MTPWALIPLIDIDTGKSPYIHFNLRGPQILLYNNNFLRNEYNKTIFPLGYKAIEDELIVIKSVENPETKLDRIFLWEMNDWHNPQWETEIFYHPYGDTTFLTYDWNNSRFKVNPLVEHRLFLQKNPNGTLYSSDPYTLAYTKVGSCRELSNLFSYMANRSGIPTRFVQTVTHQWLEVQINGEWFYYDPWCAVEKGYYNRSNPSLTFKSKWFNKPEYYRENCNCSSCLIFYPSYPFFNPSYY